MKLVAICDDCGYADGGHAPTCQRARRMSEYERLKEQKDAILAKEKARGDALMKQLEGTLMGKLKETEAERDRLRAALVGIQAMAAEELRTEELHLSTSMWQIEADARAALEPTP